MKNLLIITQKVDETDDLLGFFVGWLREFSKKFNKVFVITLAKGKYSLPSNVFVYSLGKERSASKISQFLAFYKFLFRLTPGISGIFAHMSPIFVVASWPIAKVFRKKIILWYLHRSITKKLKLAESLCYKIATANKESLNLSSPKVVELGHGIDIDFFKTKREFRAGKLNILRVGRISPIKDYETLIKTASILKDKGLNFEIKVIGRPIMKSDFSYLESLKDLLSKLSLNDYIEFVGFVPYLNMPKFYKEADLSINLAPKGGLDKVVLEAMVAGCIVLTSNTVFRKYFAVYGDHLIFTHNDEVDLAEKVMGIANLSNLEKRNISIKMVQAVEKNHNLKNLISSLAELF